ncbi:MAG: SDR family oxidoreductase [Alphaproteobacteria bacterium]|nr:SDR family oxidoreductase [Alphaproteobacteria bacterium]
MKNCYFILGFGYTAEFLAKKLIEFDLQVIGTTRSSEKIGFYPHSNYELVNFSAASVEKYLKIATHVLVSIPPAEEKGDLILANFSDLIKKLSHQIKWLGYLSSTSVYGNHQGDWVDETSESILPSKQGLLRLDAEKAWFSLANDYRLPLHIFRLAGIYGPTRSALVKLLRGKKETIYKKGHFFSRIHVEDIVSALVASIKKPHPISIYNIADDEPAPSYVIDDYAASLLNMPPITKIPFEIAKLSPVQKEFYLHNRRVCNSKMKKDLLVKLKYPTYREGLNKLLKDEVHLLCEKK